MPLRTTAHRRATRTVRSVSLAAALALLVTLVAPSPAAAGPAAAPGVAAMVVAELHLLDLECIDENDDGWWGSDEPFIVVNGQRVWDAENFDLRDIELIHIRIPFDELVTVEMWEDDGGLRAGDDHMASWYVFAAEVGSGVHKVRTQRTYGTYDLRYEVV
jgi:hypothetical protein